MLIDAKGSKESLEKLVNKKTQENVGPVGGRFRGWKNGLRRTSELLEDERTD